MTAEEILECTMIASVAGNLVDGKLQQTRPFRSPHHSCSMPAMVGGGMGKRISPGEISRAHNGVLFLDELPEFPRLVLEALRQPLESGKILISRAAFHVTYPARFQLVAAMNPCKCGYLSDPERACNRVPNCGIDYQSKISGPIFDRIDIYFDIPQLDSVQMATMAHSGETSADIAKRVAEARNMQHERYQGYGIKLNSELEGSLLTNMSNINNLAYNVLNDAANKMKLSMRGYNRVIKLARTIADMDDSSQIHKHHIAEALGYRYVPLRKASANQKVMA
jgi:magnesium chelatase family protein